MAGIKESFTGKINRKLQKKLRVVDVAAGRQKADLVFKNAKYLNVFSNEFCTGDIAVAEGLVVGMGEYSGINEVDVSGKLVLPGLIDAHIHLESTLLSPAEFARAVLPHGTTTVICDPHEIANVMGVDGIEYMIEATEGLPVDVHFMLPSCVPSTPLDESGARLDYRAIDSFYEHGRVLGLAEMMNFVGVIGIDVDCIEKIVAAQSHHKKIDGHAPGLSGNPLNAYMAAGVYSDHECATIEEALEKLRKGQFIMIREGTAAKNLNALMPLLNEKYYSRCMFATDDRHPNDILSEGHIDCIVRKAIAAGADPIIALKVASHHAARYFLMNNKGAIAPGYLADLIVVDDLDRFNVLEVYKKGTLRYSNGQVLDFERPEIDDNLRQQALDTFRVNELTPASFFDTRRKAIIGMVKGEIITTDDGYADGVDTEKDVLKIAVIERHRGTGHIGLGYLRGYGMKRGAVATSVSHDSHNIIVVGENDADMAAAANRITHMHGGICVVERGEVIAELPLEIAGLMSGSSIHDVNQRLESAKAAAHRLGVSDGIDPFMTLSFMSLAVIPTLRLTTRGVIDVLTQRYV
ncbi:MAG: adenine deaminase [Clostridia bacterium]|nr:adenine deaminase [Clostridia bacterium]